MADEDRCDACGNPACSNPKTGETFYENGPEADRKYLLCMECWGSLWMPVNQMLTNRRPTRFAAGDLVTCYAGTKRRYTGTIWGSAPGEPTDRPHSALTNYVVMPDGEIKSEWVHRVDIMLRVADMMIEHKVGDLVSVQLNGRKCMGRVTQLLNAHVRVDFGEASYGEMIFQKEVVQKTSSIDHITVTIKIPQDWEVRLEKLAKALGQEHEWLPQLQREVEHLMKEQVDAGGYDIPETRLELVRRLEKKMLGEKTWLLKLTSDLALLQSMETGFACNSADWGWRRAAFERYGLTWKDKTKC